MMDEDRLELELQEPAPDEPDCDWFKELQVNVKANGISPISFLPVLGVEGYIRENRSHLLASYPKGGKTELMVNIAMEWPDQVILYVTEEGRETWMDRAFELPKWPNEMLVWYALGKKHHEILDVVRQWAGSVVIIDTIKILGIENENDASQVQAALEPFITACRRRKQTLIFIHHDNKGSAKGGRGIAGSHAFVGIVDIFLELDEVRDEPNRRSLTGRGKIRNIERLIYERQDDGSMKALSSVVLTTEVLVVNAITDDWQTTLEVEELCDMSRATVQRHLLKLAERNVIERDPPIGDESKGKTLRWRRKQF
jgi:DNA repair protein RadA/Sms